jgi:hypothetical protein
MSYTIWCERSAVGGIVTNVLGKDNKWYVAANNVHNFDSVYAARKFFFSDAADSVEPVGSNIWIRGPRGGIYPMRREQ